MIFKPVLIEKILAGEKTVTRRPSADGPCRYRTGKVYGIQPGMARPSVARIQIEQTGWRYLHDIDDEDAQREGFRDRDDFVSYWIGLYGSFDPDMGVWRIRFNLVDQVATVCANCEGKGVVAHV